MVSTLGIPKAMIKLATEHPQVHLALSLHATTDALRSEIMPINDRHNISELVTTIQEIEKIHHYPVMVSYILFDGINSSPQQAKELAEIMENRRIIFNLIPFNHIPGEQKFKRTSEEQLQPFKNTLIQAGFQVTVRRSFGPDIDAACGQLAASTSTNSPSPL
jgi:23S rRNA (adenine2503-C2)-methyltransferase